jgi:DNA adenine methylase
VAGGHNGPRPFLKWAGGKRQLLRALLPFVPASFSRYVEPFLGSGAVFFELYGSGALATREAVLADTNADLVGVYSAIATDVDALLESLEVLADGHASGGSAHYYEVRDRLFNPRRRELDIRNATDVSRYPVAVAAMFIYLNRTGFNGLFRLNAKGDFNVPAGRYQNPRICDAANLRAVASALRSRTVSLHHDPFAVTLGRCRAGDFIYLDPPYAPMSSTSRFTSYTAGGFSDEDQRRLQHEVIRLAARGCSVLLSNSTAPIIEELYERDPAPARVGLRAFRVPARRAINSDPRRRGPVDEFLITNCVRSAADV